MPGSGHGSAGVERVKGTGGEPPKKQSTGVLSPHWIPAYGSDDRGSGGGGSNGDYHLPSIQIEFPEEVRKDMDHLVNEIKENLKLGGSGPLSPPLPLQEDPLPSFGGGKLQYGKARSSAHLSHRVSRASPYHVPPSSRQCDISSNQAASGNSGMADGSTLDATEQMRQQQIRRKQRWGHQRRRYPSTCMNNNGFGSSKVCHAATTALEDGPDDPFAMLQELISDGGLIKEAVRRLQLGRLTPKCFNPTGTTTQQTTGGTGSGLASGGGRAYDSDDDESCRTPPEHEFTLDAEADDDEEEQQHHNRHHPLQHVSSSHPNSIHGVTQGVVGANHQRPFPCCEVGL
jgi:hypothetical protein